MVGSCQITLPGVISATVEPLTLQGTVSPSMTLPRYPGPYDVTPAAAAQVLATKGLAMSADVSVGGMGEAIEKAERDAIRTIVDGSFAGEYRDEELTEIKVSAFSRCKQLTGLDLPNATDFGASFASECTSLTDVYLPKLENAYNSSPQSEFSYCTALERLRLPKLAWMGWHMVYGCTSLRHADQGTCNRLIDYSTCPRLETLVVRRTSSVTIMGSASDISSSSPIANGTGYIYVPRALVEKYKVATNWSVYADQIRAIEDYPDICDPDD